MDENEEIDYEEEIRDFKKRYVIKHTIVTIFLLIIVACFSSEITQIYSMIDIKKPASTESLKNINAISENLKSFRRIIDKMYVGDIDEQKMMDESIKGYVNGLGDEYSEYLTKEEWEDFNEAAFGNFVGIGVIMGIDTNGNIVIVQVIDDSPAQEAGIQEDDIIAEADGTSLLGQSADLASSIIKGHEGTTVHLKLIRNNEIVEMDVLRRQIELYKVETKMLDDEIGYILFQTFDDGSAEEVRVAYEELKAQGAKKIILDLRDNTGGVVEEAENIADLFLDKDQATIITVDKDKKEDIAYTKKEKIITEPLVVLVNQYSASASEMLAGVLKDYGRADLVGTKTYGKGVMQTVMMLEDGSALKLTTAEYFTPSRTKINKEGIEPTCVVEADKKSEEDVQLNKAIEIIKSK